MSYRTLKIGSDTYKYVIGKTHVKVRGLFIVEKSKIGISFRDDYIVTPGMIADYITHGKIFEKEKYFGECEHDAPKTLGYAPYACEIEGKNIICNWCDDCFMRNAEDI